MSEPERLLKLAEIFFKFAFAFLQPLSFKLQYLDKFYWGKHKAEKKDLKLTREQENLSIALLHHVATCTLATQIDTYLQEVYPDRFKHSDKNIRDASWIVRLIRNAYSHNQFNPTWQFYGECRNKTFDVEKVLALDTTHLEGKFVGRLDYGGPLALLALSRFVRSTKNLLK